MLILSKTPGVGMMVYEELTQKIIGCAFKVHKVLGSGYLEKVYENALCFELANKNRIFYQWFKGESRFRFLSYGQ